MAEKLPLLIPCPYRQYVERGADGVLITSRCFALEHRKGRGWVVLDARLLAYFPVRAIPSPMSRSFRRQQYALIAQRMDVFRFPLVSGRPMATMGHPTRVEEQERIVVK